MNLYVNAAILIAVVASCGDPASENARQATELTGVDALIATPAGVPCRIIEEGEGNKIPGVKRTVTVHLSGKTTEEDLRGMAQAIQSSVDVSYLRTFIFYVLPGMPDDSGVWATTHFNPDLEVSILGSTMGTLSARAGSDTTNPSLVANSVRIDAANEATAILIEMDEALDPAAVIDESFITLDGLNPHFVAIDELHAHKSRDVYDVIDSATGSRSQPLLWSITTAGGNKAGICYEIRSYTTQILNSALHKHDGMDY